MKLEKHGGNHYLTRYSTSKKKYVLSVARNGNFDQFDLVIEKHGESYVNGSEMKFEDVFALLSYYHHNRLSPTIDGIGDPLPVGSSASENQDISHHKVQLTLQNKTGKC